MAAVAVTVHHHHKQDEDEGGGHVRRRVDNGASSDGKRAEGGGSQRHEQGNGSCGREPRIGVFEYTHAVTVIQRVFRGYHSRQKRRRADPLINARSLMTALDRADRERMGFFRLCGYLLYLSLFIAVVLSRLDASNRFNLESALVETMTNVATPDGLNYEGVSSKSDVYELARAYLHEFYHVGPGEQVLGLDLDVNEVREAASDAFDEIVENFADDDELPASPQQKQEVVDRAVALVPELARPDTTGDFSCHQELTSKGFMPTRDLLMPPEVLAAWTLSGLRANLTGSRFPSLSAGAGEFLQYSRLTGAMMLSMTRRQQDDCDLGDHSGVFDTCYHEDVPDTSDFTGGYSGYKYEINDHGGRYFVLMDLGTFGFGERTERCQLERLDMDGWLGAHTKEARFVLSLFNGNVGLLARATVEFEFTLGGHVSPTLTVSSTALPDNEVLGLWTVLQFLLIVALVLVTLARLILTIVRLVKERKHLSTSDKVWDCFAIGFYILVIATEAVDLSIRKQTSDLKSYTAEEIMSRDDPFELLVNQALEIESISSLETTFSTMSSFIYMLALLRLLKYFQFHDRLNVITRTLAVGANDLFHFLLVFGCVTVLYSAVAVTSFGSQLEEYHTFTSAFESFMLILLGDFAYADVERVAPIMGPVVFWTFVFVVFFVLLNVFLSIIVDAYILVKEDASDASGFLPSLLGAMAPHVASVRLRIKYLCQVYGCGARLYKKPLPPEVIEAMRSKWGGRYRVAPSMRSMRSLQTSDAPTASPYKNGPVSAARLALMGSVYAPPRAIELSAPLRILAAGIIRGHILGSEPPITRLDVRKAIGPMYDKQTVTDIMSTFGKVPDEKDEQADVAAARRQRTRVVQKTILRAMRTLNAKLDVLMNNSSSSAKMAEELSKSLHNLQNVASSNALFASERNIPGTLGGDAQ